MLIIEPNEIWADRYTVDGGVLVGDAAHSFHPGLPFHLFIIVRRFCGPLIPDP
jgi:hypothetical protein